MAREKIERVGSMIDGLICPVIINGQTKNCKVKSETNGDLYLVLNGRKFYETDLPFGEEVIL